MLLGWGMTREQYDEWLARVQAGMPVPKVREVVCPPPDTRPYSQTCTYEQWIVMMRECGWWTEGVSEEEFWARIAEADRLEYLTRTSESPQSSSCPSSTSQSDPLWSPDPPDPAALQLTGADLQLSAEQMTQRPA